MSLLTVIFVFVIVGLLLWVIQTFIPMDAKVKLLLQVVVVIFLILWLIRGFGFVDIRI